MPEILFFDRRYLVISQTITPSLANLKLLWRKATDMKGFLGIDIVYDNDYTAVNSAIRDVRVIVLDRGYLLISNSYLIPSQL